MLFNSYEFLFGFFPAVLVVIFGLRRLGAFRLAKTCLIAASLIFYAWWDWRFVGLLLASALLNWMIGRLIVMSKNRRGAMAMLALGLCIDLGTLATFKYGLFLADALTFHLGERSSLYIWILPLGISFWTFEQIIFLVDTYRGEQNRLSLKDYLAFVTFFPRLIAGPIIRPRDFFASYAQWTSPIPGEFIAAGATLISIGLFKKVCLADQLGQIVNPVFKLADGGSPVTTLDAWAATLGFAFQIYFDFSGYSDIAIGLALIFGIRLPPNFDFPYKSVSIVEFWRRWHISLSTFLRDYLYIPLGGNRRGRLREAANIMMTMGLGGLWHGAGVNFLIWGLLHGCYVTVAHFGARAIPLRGRLVTGASAVLTFGAVLLAWVYFRADSFSGATTILEALFGRTPFSSGAHFLFGAPLQIVLLAYSTFHCLLLPGTRALFRQYILPRPAEQSDAVSWKPSLAWASLSAIMVTISIWLMLGDKREFIYFQF